MKGRILDKCNVISTELNAAETPKLTGVHKIDQELLSVWARSLGNVADRKKGRKAEISKDGGQVNSFGIH